MHLHINTGNAAFEDDNKGYEVARIFEVAAEIFSQGEKEFNLRDVNGNTVGEVRLKGVAPIGLEPGSIVLSMDTGNAAFDEPNGGWEVARILREAADRVRDSHFNFQLRDINGNKVGECGEVPQPAPSKKAEPKENSVENDLPSP